MSSRLSDPQRLVELVADQMFREEMRSRNGRRPAEENAGAAIRWALPLQTFVYRQLMYLVVLQSVASAVQGLRLRWQNVERSGEVEVSTPGVTAPD